MIIHIFERDKFTNSYINFINSEFEQNEHRFYIMGSEGNYKIDKYDNVINICGKSKNIINLFNDLCKSDKIIIHGLFNRKIVCMFFLLPFLLKKSYWTIWGGDLYWHEFRPHSIREDIFEYIRRYVIKNIFGIITHIYGDYQLAQKWYGAKGKYFYSFLYLSNVFNEKYTLLKKEKKGEIFIQVGNSADSSNNHIDILRKIYQYKNKKIKIICPLSYGDTEYRDKVIKEGEKLFGEKFSPILKFEPIEKYLESISKIDVAIFNNNRQQAVGNITTLLGMGKKVYIRDDVTTWDFAKRHKLKVYSTNSDLNSIFDSMPKEYIRSNKKYIKEYFSLDKLKDSWERIFNY